MCVRVWGGGCRWGQGVPVGGGRGGGGEVNGCIHFSLFSREGCLGIFAHANWEHPPTSSTGKKKKKKKSLITQALAMEVPLALNNFF